MPPTSFDINRALEALKSETPRHIPTAGAVLSSGRPHTRARRMRLVLVGGATFVALGLLWPRGTSSVAFGQVQENLGAQRRIHVVTRFKVKSKKAVAFKTSLVTENWLDGDKYSFTMNGDRSPLYRSVSDGKYSISYIDHGRNRNNTPQIAWRVAVTPGSRPELFLNPIGPQAKIVDDLIKMKNMKVLGQKNHGALIQYRIQDTVHKGTMLVYADPKTRLVSKVEVLSKSGEPAVVTDIEFPESIDPKVFEFSVPGVQVRDVADVRSKVSENLKKGLGSQAVAGKTITLRAVLYDRNGGLWVLWTGGAPKGDLKHPVRVKGFPTPKVLPYSFPIRQPTVNAFGLKAFTSGAEKANVGKPSPIIGERLGGMGIRLVDQKFERVTLIVPVLDSTGAKLGEAKFENVSVVRIGSIYGMSDILGIR